MNCLPPSFPNQDLSPPRGPSCTQEAPSGSCPFQRPSSGRGVSDLMFFCLSFSQFFQLFVQGSHTVNHEGGLRSPWAARIGPDSGPVRKESI